MRVRIRLFAGLRERAGTGSRELELADGATLADVWRGLELGDEPPGLLYAVNKRYASSETPLSHGDEVAVIPPVSGGDFRLTAEPLSLDAVVREVARDEAGAIATFLGTVRSRSRDRNVLYLEYEAYEGMAEEMMAELARDLSEKHELAAVAIHHRTGRVEIGEPSVAIAVSSPHRAAALAACKEAIDTLKGTVPLWKKEVYEGGEEWIGQGS
ncbi:MAG: molybdenum cofactor biosynthesis protein MoaE [Actinomycetota bacterium]|nr:molybdenum cofactor biosynthesis protein MoaE [Actinomycetota bacterium]